MGHNIPHETVDFSRVALGNDEHPTVGEVLDIAMHVELFGQMACRVTEPYTLYPASIKNFTSLVLFVLGGHHIDSLSSILLSLPERWGIRLGCKQMGSLAILRKKYR